METITFNAAEKYQSQIPAFQMLVVLGFTPLFQTDALRSVALDDVLAEQLLNINSFTHRGRDYPFNLADAHEVLKAVA